VITHTNWCWPAQSAPTLHKLEALVGRSSEPAASVKVSGRAGTVRRSVSFIIPERSQGKTMDVQFEISGYPSTAVGLAMREAVFSPLMGNMPVQWGFRDGMLKLIEMWRARAAELFSAGWDRIQGSRYQCSRDCPPPFADVSPRGLQPCRLTRICPFCWARDVRRVSIRMDDARCGLQRGIRRFDLLEFQHEITDIPFAGPHAATPEMVVAEADRSRPGIAGRDVLGGLVSTIIQPPHDPAGENPQWRVTHRVMLLVLPALMRPTDIQQNSRRLSNPTSRQLALAVARTCRYPTGLMDSNIEPTVALLQAMTDRQMSNHHGFSLGSRTDYSTYDDGADES